MSRDAPRGVRQSPFGGTAPQVWAEFRINSKDFFFVTASFLSFDPAMSSGKNAATDNVQWYVQADRAARRLGHASGYDDRRANSLALIITTSLLFVLFASALLVGGHAIIGPLLRASPAADGNANERGDIVYTMPDGMFCRHMTFDNSTGRIIAGGIDHCDPTIGDGAAGRGTGFRWGSH
jgi:hypothetical protein